MYVCNGFGQFGCACRYVFTHDVQVINNRCKDLVQARRHLYRDVQATRVLYRTGFRGSWYGCVHMRLKVYTASLTAQVLANKMYTHRHPSQYG